MTGDEAKAEEWTRLHPGEVLLKEFLEPLGISQRRIGDLVRGKSAVTLDTGLRLAHYFCTADDFWLRAQMDYDLMRGREPLGTRIKHEIKSRCPPK